MYRRVRNVLKACMNDVVHGRSTEATRIVPETGTSVSCYIVGEHTYQLTFTLRKDDIPKLTESKEIL